MHFCSLLLCYVHVNLNNMKAGGPKKNGFRPVIKEPPQSFEALKTRGASWNPANRFEKLHVDLTDVDVVDPTAALEERPRRQTQYLRDDTKSIVSHNNSPDVGFEVSLNPYRGC